MRSQFRTGNKKRRWNAARLLLSIERLEARLNLADLAWDGPHGGNFNWDHGQNWNPDGVPAGDDIVAFANYISRVELGANAVANEVQVRDSDMDIILFGNTLSANRFAVSTPSATGPSKVTFQPVLFTNRSQ